MLQKYKVYINNCIKIINENWDAFCHDYKIVDAAGGIVFNDKEQLLMIFRNGKWDLPKGKVEFNENIKECAIREVEEECGVSDLLIEGNEIITYHTYSEERVDILKRTHWFVMNTKYNKKLTPQFEEGIKEVCWVDINKINEKLINSYKSIEDLVRTVLN
jgi:ADP-ribose pyrophosphatase YjhB (NUDIX family)